MKEYNEFSNNINNNNNNNNNISDLNLINVIKEKYKINKRKRKKYIYLSIILLTISFIVPTVASSCDSGFEALLCLFSFFIPYLLYFIKPFWQLFYILHSLYLL